MKGGAIMLLSVTSKPKKGSCHLRVGTYNSVVVSIDFDPDYCVEEALLVKYILTDDNGRSYDYQEIFFNQESNVRTQNFFDYLVKNGIPLERFTDFKGCCEKLTIRKTARGNRPMLTIEKREFVSHAAGDENAVSN